MKPSQQHIQDVGWVGGASERFSKGVKDDEKCTSNCSERIPWKYECVEIETPNLPNLKCQTLPWVNCTTRRYGCSQQVLCSGRPVQQIQSRMDSLIDNHWIDRQTILGMHWSAKSSGMPCRSMQHATVYESCCLPLASLMTHVRELAMENNQLLGPNCRW